MVKEQDLLKTRKLCFYIYTNLLLFLVKGLYLYGTEYILYCIQNTDGCEKMNHLNLRAYGKVNLGLDVVRKREDGYHEVRMIMQTVNVFDRVELIRQKEPGIRVKTNLFYLPVNENNLVYKAAKLLMDEFEIKQGIFISLKKYIPVSAGMAGGSTDAAAVLYGMNRMFSLGLSMDELKARGLKLGADIPYCLMRGTALAEGIGEKLTPLLPPPKCFVLIAKPPVSVSTKFVYENLKAGELKHHPDIDGMIEALNEQDLEKLAGRMENVLETVTIPAYPVIEELKVFMKKHGAMNAIMSGSGPTVFGLFLNPHQAKRAYWHLKDKKLVKQIYLTGFYNN